MAEQDFKIIVVGGGIAGLSAAIALRDENRSITVYEQSSRLREIGAGISLQPNASRIVEDVWDLKTTLGKCSSIDNGFRIYQADGTFSKEIRMDKSGKWGNRVVYHRKDLQDGLIEASINPNRKGKPVTINLSKRVISCDHKLGTVTFADATTDSAHLIIAADGIKSKIRTILLGKPQAAVPTGISAYRFMIPMDRLESVMEFTQHINPREEYTTMVLCHDRRLVMGPVRNAESYSVVALIPDENLHEDASSTDWTSQGDISKFLESFSILPDWLLKAFRPLESLGLWQLRDLEPLNTWYKGRTILIGDAAHAMLPTQGQGASQAIEDAEALGAFFDGIEDFSALEVNKRLAKVFQARYERATLIQKYSRQQARPATQKGSLEITMKPEEFAVYNYAYKGAKAWLEEMQQGQPVEQ